MHIPRSNRTQSRFDTTMTPMIDVIFQLLIFFICTASFLPPERVLPTSLSVAVAAGSTPAEAPPPQVDLTQVVVKVTSQGGQIVWTVHGEPRTDPGEVRGLLKALAEVMRELPLVIDVAPDVPLSYAIDLYDWCRLAGFAKIQFAASLER